MQPAGQLAQLAAGDARLLAGGGEALDAPAPGRRSSSRSARSSAWPSTTSRCCAPSCRSRPIRRRSSSAACTARARLATTSSRAGAQRALVAAALELGAGAGGEDLQRLQLARRGVQRARRDDADVADRRGRRRRAAGSPGSRRARARRRNWSAG